jgi:hypothetical protein
MCTSKGALYAGESFNLDSADPGILPGFEDDVLVFRNDPANSYVPLEEIPEVGDIFEEYDKLFEPQIVLHKKVQRIFLQIIPSGDIEDAYENALPYPKRKKIKRNSSRRFSLTGHSALKQRHKSQGFETKTHLIFDKRGNVLKKTEVFKTKKKKFSSKEHKDSVTRRLRKEILRERFSLVA